MLLPWLFGALLAALERSPRLRFRRQRLLRRYFTDDVLHALVGFGAGGALAVAYFEATSGWLGAYTGLPGLWESVPGWLAVAVAFVLLDLGNYLAHWLLHRVDWLWELHKVHHSSRELDWLATFRSHPLEQVLRRLLAPAGLILLGAPLGAVMAAAGLFTAWAALNHANLTLPLGSLERALITPRLHRVHHVPEASTKNLGTVFSVWDRLRGTLLLTAPPPAAVFGVPGEVEAYPQTWGRQLLAPLRALPGRSTAPAESRAR
jgi:sterol desaturase/sphingolipid hydroxylase (fatty acid hydroxylase superfamily)